MSVDTAAAVKKEVQNMFQAGIIQPAKYSQWLSNIVPVRKKNGKIHVCVDYRNLNVETPKDVYPMPVADMLVDAVVGHELLSFMDGTAGYHQIPVYEPDRQKTAFRCPGFTGVFEYNNMTNAGATYQRAMNLIFHDVLGGKNLRTVFTRMRKHKLRMNPTKCIFGVRSGDFLGFIVHERGIEIAEDKAKAVLDASAPRNKKELQSLLGKINFLRRFISNSAGKTAVFSPLMRLKADQKFQWGPEPVFDKIKEYLTHPPVLRPPQPGIPLKLYISASPYSIAGLLAQDGDGEGGKKIEHAVYYLSRTLLEVETRYSPIEKLCLALYFIGTKLRHYILSFTTVVVAQTDLVKYMLTRPMLRGWIAQLATGIRLADGVRERILKVQRRTLPSFMARIEIKDEWLVAVIDSIDVDWQQLIIQYLIDPSTPVDKRVRYLATNYVLRGDELLRRAEDGLYLRCIYGADVRRAYERFIVAIVVLTKLHKHILLATDFFTKWVDAIPVKTTFAEVITDFIYKYIITRYGIPECLVADSGAGFMAEKTQKFLADYGIKFLHSSPYYAQSNGQAKSLRVREHHQLIGEDYVQAMYQEHEDLDSRCMESFNSLIAEKKKIARLYDKRTRGRSFGVGDLVWQACLPYGERVDSRGKWSAKWEGPFVIDRVMGNGAYYLRDTDGNVHRNPMNGRHLKKYFPSVWEYEDPPAAVHAK
ncbi:uncharacterized protein LOC126784029 [Argentina anserina]|uniref:uncharacterized protein LOC126784029 n=1 Tax=Argentina anserina TaxID=57926 RepID=UPI0021767763|nr:uncharacterized protein LOC126784029 [Potentilla anserina]